MPRQVSWEQMQARFAQAHGTLYDYSQAQYAGTKAPIKIVGPAGDFWQSPEVHAKGHGDPRLSSAAQSLRQRDDREAFLAKAQRVHAGAYRYLQVVYVDSTTPVLIECPEHGMFSQRPNKHLQGQGCRACSYAKRAGDKRKPVEVFQEQAQAVHNGKYTYEAFVYAGAHVGGQVHCPRHGGFEVDPSNHLAGKGCPRCGHTVSKADGEIAAFLGDAAVLNARLGGKQWDVYLPQQRIVIEHHGLAWHSTRVLPLAQARERHREARLLAQSLGLRYVALYEDEWRDRRALCESYLRHLTGGSERVGARALRLAPVASGQARAFYARHHFLSAGAAGSLHMGLHDACGLVACMSMGVNTAQRGSAGDWCLTRYCTDGRTVPGAAQRLFKALLAQVPESVGLVSYVDLDKYDGGLYKRLGFVSDRVLAPDYWTVHGRVRKHKTATKRSALAKRADFDPAQSEYENCQRMGLYRVYHSGRMKLRFR